MMLVGWLLFLGGVEVNFGVKGLVVYIFGIVRIDWKGWIKYVILLLKFCLVFFWFY